MSLLLLNNRLGRWRGRLGLLAVVACLGAAVALHHSQAGDVHGMADAVMCLAVLGAAALAIVMATPPPSPSRPRIGEVALPEPVDIPCPATAARDGPTGLQVFLS